MAGYGAINTRMRLVTLLLLCFLRTVAVVSAHEHMYIASTAHNGGGLVLEYDFARSFPLAELPNRLGTWIGVDPSFNSLVADDPSGSRYRLKTGAKVVVEIVSIDGAVSVGVIDRTLTAAGDRATVGTMPYLHVHPQWTLTLPVGGFGEGHVSFRIRSSGYAPSPVYAGTLLAAPPPTTTSTTATTSTTFEGQTTTTTTTLAPVCTTVLCDDQDPCTDDVCDGAVCRHDVAMAAAAVLCRLRGFQNALDHEQPAGKPAQRMLGRLYKLVTQARVATQAARAAGTPRKFRKVGVRLSRLTSLVDAADRGGLLPADAVAVLQTLSTTAYDAFALWHQTNS